MKVRAFSVHDMTVAAPIPEAVDTGATNTVCGPFPVDQLLGHIKLPVLEVDIGVGGLEMHVRWDLSFL